MAHDPANTLVNELKRRGFDTIVLTRYNYKTGLIDDPLPDKNKVEYLRWVRLYDCRETLRS